MWQQMDTTEFKKTKFIQIKKIAKCKDTDLSRSAIKIVVNPKRHGLFGQLDTWGGAAAPHVF